VGKKKSDEQTERQRLHEWLDSVGGRISLGHSELSSIEISKSGNKLSIVLKKNKPEKKPVEDNDTIEV
jgi:hypothetical protein